MKFNLFVFIYPTLQLQIVHRGNIGMLKLNPTCRWIDIIIMQCEPREIEISFIINPSVKVNSQPYKL